MGVMEERFRALAACDPVLPAAYRRAHYIQSTTSAYISTDYVPQRYDEFAVDFMLVGTPSSMQCLLSAGTGSYQLIFLEYGSSGSSYYCRYFSSGNAATFDAGTSKGNRYQMTISSGGVFALNGQTITKASDGTLDGNNTNLWIFRRRNDTYPFIGKLYGFTVTNKGTKTLELIPCVRVSDSVAGVYDTVSRTFYSSANSDSFIAG